MSVSDWGSLLKLDMKMGRLLALLLSNLDLDQDDHPSVILLENERSLSMEERYFLQFYTQCTRNTALYGGSMG
jgi:hypothetical protein